MEDESKPALSRRALLASAGGVAGAAALGAVAPVAEAAEPVPGPNDPSQGFGTAATSGYPPLIVVPGIHYTTYGQFAFQPTVISNGKTVSGYGAYCNVANGYMVASVELEAGAQLTELTVGVCNSSGSSVNFAFESYPIAAGGGGAIVGTVSTPTGGATTVQVNATSLSSTISSNNTYDLAMFTFASGTVRVFSARIGYIPLGYGFVPVTPTRVYDSRAGNPPLGVTKGQLSNGTRVINMLNGLSLPVTPKGVLTNLTVVNTSASGFISLFKNGITWPGTSSINWFTANEVVANTAYTDVDASGQAIAKVPANSSTDFFIDVVGYYA